MKTNFPAVIFYLSLILSTVGCSAFYDKDYGEISYTGDGKFVDKGRESSHDRFLLDLGQIDPKQKTKLSYLLKGLPEVPFTIAFQIDLQVSNNFPLDSPSLYPQLKFINEVILSLELEDANGVKVLGYSGPLAKLDRNVKQTEEGYKPIYYLERRGDASGTNFTPKNNMSYRLNLNVIETNQMHTKVKVIAIGHSGWK